MNGICPFNAPEDRYDDLLEVKQRVSRQAGLILLAFLLEVGADRRTKDGWASFYFLLPSSGLG
jgi:hypothetical protein